MPEACRHEHQLLPKQVRRRELHFPRPTRLRITCTDTSRLVKSHATDDHTSPLDRSSHLVIERLITETRWATQHPKLRRAPASSLLPAARGNILRGHPPPIEHHPQSLRNQAQQYTPRRRLLLSAPQVPIPKFLLFIPVLSFSFSFYFCFFTSHLFLT
jgi:hypothetical protein